MSKTGKTGKTGKTRRFDGMPHARSRPQTFDVARCRDHSGVSGEGDVACGVMFPDGTVVVQWQTAVRSVVVYSSVADMLYIHGHGESTGIRFHDQPERLYLYDRDGEFMETQDYYWDGKEWTE